jgi:CheY-like chemotaxis protein
MNIVNDRKDAERAIAAAALEAQKLESIGVLAAGIAHDFNNLLTCILGNLELAAIQLPPGDPARSCLEIAGSAAHKAAVLVAQMLAYARKSGGHPTTFDLSALVAELIPLVETSIPKTVRLDLSLAPGLPWLAADIAEIQQIVMNLVINGGESFGPAGGVLRVSTGLVSDGIFLEVRDFGCGMTEATKRRIFEPFFTTKFTGRGLGLAAVSGIVSRLNARMDIQTAPGEGSTFRIVFPAVSAQLPAMEPAAPQSSSGAGLILVVDDDPTVRNLARTALQICGYSVLSAENGKAALEIFRDNSGIAAVLMDLTMPVMGGSEAFMRMNQIRPGVPFIICSGFSETAVREQFIGVPAGVLLKPFTLDEFRDKIASVLVPAKSVALKVADASGAL